MAGTTPNYGFPLPDPTDLMSDVKQYITDPFKKIEPLNDTPVIAAGQPLPQSGNFNIGDKVFRNDPAGGNTWPSTYILVVKDANWGWHWRPIQQIISPWVDVPASAISDTATFQLVPIGTFQFRFQIAMDSRGWTYWRGPIQTKVGGIATNTNLLPFKQLPVMLRPNVPLNRVCPLTALPSGALTGKAANITARFRVAQDGTNTLRCFNSSSTTLSFIWFDGMAYNNALNRFTSA